MRGFALPNLLLFRPRGALQVAERVWIATALHLELMICVLMRFLISVTGFRRNRNLI